MSFKDVLQSLASGELSVEEAALKLRSWSIESFDDAMLDHDRAQRQGVAEVVFAEGKRSYEVAAISERLFNATQTLLCTRASLEDYEAVLEKVPSAQYQSRARIIWAREKAPAPVAGKVGIFCAGTSDLPVAEEAFECAKHFGLEPSLYKDIGVAGLHRLASVQGPLFESDVVIAIAGMDAALISVVGGLVSVPIIGVPTSVGYGAALGGLSALHSMLVSCAAGISVVNIDNGFGAARAAHRMLSSLSPKA